MARQLTVRVMCRFRVDDLKVIEALARAEGMPRSLFIRRALREGVARITQAAVLPQNVSAGPRQARRSRHLAGDGQDRQRAER